MHPGPKLLLQSCSRLFRRPVSGSALAALALFSGQAWAQETPVGASDPVAFEADKVEYIDQKDLFVANGNVLLRRGDESVRADTVEWNATTGAIVASGNVRLVDRDGNQLFVQSVTLDDKFEAGTMQDMLLALREGGRMAAKSGQRDAQGRIELAQAAYSACEIEDRQGCEKKPSWRITANRVLYDPETKLVRFKGARLELFGAPLLPLPGLSVTTDGRAVSGFLPPDFSYSPSNGGEMKQSYYMRLAPDKDLTTSLHLFTDSLPMASAQYRQLTGKGAFQITGFATRSKRVDISGGTGTYQRFRGHLATNGRFQFSPEWSLTFSGRLASDRTFLRRYDISRDDRLRSMLEIERIGPDSYLSIAGWATQTLRTNASQGQVPIALPVIDWRLRLGDPVFGGKVELQANSMAITRTSGQDTRRAFAGARWELRRLTGMGQEVTLTGLVRGDVYNSHDNALTINDSGLYRGQSGWKTRGVATAALDVRWPFTGPLLGGTQVLTPRVQVVASPQIRNLAVPNEDARAIDLEDSNLFALNRFPGHDRIEDGVRFTYGLDWQLDRPRWRVKSTVGQSYRLTDKPTLLPDGTGLTSRTSDIVGRTEIRYRDFLKLTHRFRIDKDNLTPRRNEFDATIGSERTYAEIGYLRLNRNAAAKLEDLQDREELRLAGRVAFVRYWSMFGSGVFNLTNRKEDPSLKSDGFEPLRTRLGLAYQDDCIELGLTWRRDFKTTGDARKGNTFQLFFALRNFGYR